MLPAENRARAQRVVGQRHRTAGQRSLVNFCFFFSSRRRHTRCSRDWSSDVCSSDLDDFEDAPDGAATEQLKIQQRLFEFNFKVDTLKGSLFRSDPDKKKPDTLLVELRSEERRVGKECRSRWSPYH